MKIIKKLGLVLVALVLLPLLVFAQDVMEFKGRVKSASPTEVVVQSRDEGEKTFAISERTQGMENAKEGASVTVKYSERDGQLRAREIAPRQ